MKIIHIIQGNPGSNSMNGVNKIVNDLGIELSQKISQFEIWSISTESNKEAADDNLVIRWFEPKRNPFKINKKLFKAVNEISSPTLVHFHSVFIPVYHTISKILYFKKIPWIITPHGGYSKESLKVKWLKKIIYFQVYEKSFVRRATYLHASAIFEQKELEKINSNTVYIPNGFRVKKTHKFNTIQKNIREYPIFCFIGRMAIRHKGLDLLIKGFSLYQKSGGVGLLWMIGDGIERIKLEILSKELGVNKKVIFLGKKFGKDKDKYLLNSDVFIHTSRWEGMPMSVLEAASIGLPLLLSKETNLAEIIRKHQNGILLKENNPDEICEALHLLTMKWEKNQLSDLGKKSLNLIENELNWNYIAERFCKELYDPICVR